ncbi:hypothetical protein KCU89_g47, partial [Aureobasidium melanogenum]
MSTTLQNLHVARPPPYSETACPTIRDVHRYVDSSKRRSRYRLRHGPLISRYKNHRVLALVELVDVLPALYVRVASFVASLEADRIRRPNVDTLGSILEVDHDMGVHEDIGVSCKSKTYFGSSQRSLSHKHSFSMSLSKEVVRSFPESSFATLEDLEALISKHEMPPRDAGSSLVPSTYHKLSCFCVLMNITAAGFMLVGPDGVSSDHIRRSSTIALSANFCACITIRNEHVINTITAAACSLPLRTPLSVRKAAAQIYCHGGIHSGCAISGTICIITRLSSHIVFLAGFRSVCSGSRWYLDSLQRSKEIPSAVDIPMDAVPFDPCGDPQIVR